VPEREEPLAQGEDAKVEVIGACLNGQCWRAVDPYSYYRRKLVISCRPPLRSQATPAKT
jgi:hypothetical protein